MQDFWRNNPAFKILLPLLLGTVFSVLIRTETLIYFFLGLFFLIGFVFIYKRKSYRLSLMKGVLLFLVVFFFSMQWVVVKTEKYKVLHYSNHIKKSDLLHVKINDQLEEKENSWKAELKVLSVIDDSRKRVKNTQGKIVAYFKKDSLLKLNYGDELIIHCVISEIQSPKNPDQFDYQNYMFLNGYYDQVYLTPNDWKLLKKQGHKTLFNYAYQVREWCYNQLAKNGLQGDELKVASALLLGKRNELEPEQVRAYASAGAMHVLAVSGLHVGILFFILKFMLGFLKKWRRGKWFYVVLILSFLWFYAMLTGFSASVLRASTMFSFILIGEEIINRKVSIYNMLASSAIVLILIDPFIVFSVGFQLSYLAVIGIVYFQPKIYKMFYVKNWLLDQAWKITAVSLAAQIATFPLGIYYFHQFPVYFFVSNLIVIPMATLALYLGVLLLIFSSFGISVLFGTLLNYIMIALNKAVALVEEIPFSTINQISISVFENYWLYLCIVMFSISFYYKNAKHLYYSFSLLCLFFVFQWVDVYQSSKQIEGFVYSVNNQTAISFKKGKSIYFLSDSSLWKDEDQMLFSVKHHWYKSNCTNIKFVGLNELNYKDKYIYIQKGIICFNNKRYVLLNTSNIHVIKQLVVDYLLINDRNIDLLKELSQELLSSINVVFDSSVAEYKIKKVIAELSLTNFSSASSSYLKI